MHYHAADDDHLCYYCGMPATSVDHTVPRAIMYQLADEPQILHDLTVHRRLLVPCCLECNSLLGSDFDDTLADRKSRLKAKLRNRYAKYLRIPDWTDSELGRLSRGFQGFVLRGLQIRDQTRRRLSW